MAKKEKKATYDEPVEVPEVTFYSERVQIGGPKGPIAVPGDITVTLEGDVLLIREFDAKNVLRIMEWYRLYVGDIGGAANELEDSIASQADMIQGQESTIEEQEGTIESLRATIQEQATEIESLEAVSPETSTPVKESNIDVGPEEEDAVQE